MSSRYILHPTAWRTGWEYLSSCSTENRFGISFILESGEQVWNILHSTAWRTGWEYPSSYNRQVGNIIHTTIWRTGLIYPSSYNLENRFDISFILHSGEQV